MSKQKATIENETKASDENVKNITYKVLTLVTVNFGQIDDVFDDFGQLFRTKYLPNLLCFPKIFALLSRFRHARHVST